MRIAMDARDLAAPALRGMTRYLINLARELSAMGHEITLFFHEKKAIHSNHRGSVDCQIVNLPARSVVFWEQIAVPRALREGSFDLYHAPAERGVPLFSPRPVVLTYHSATAQSYRDLLKRGLLQGDIRQYLGPDGAPKFAFHEIYYRRQVHHAHRILTPSEFSRQEIVRLCRVPSDRVMVTPLGPDEQFLRSPSAPEARRALLARLGISNPYLLYVGGYEPHKNVMGLLEMFALVRTRRPELSLVCVGSSLPGDGVNGQIERLNLPRGSVQLLSNLSRELTDLYDEAELFVSMSWREAFCLPALEAMSRGTPAVASSWGATPEIIQDGGALVDPRDPAAAAQATLALLEPGTRLQASARARDLALQYSWRRTAELTVNVYDQLVSRGRRSPVAC